MKKSVPVSIVDPRVLAIKIVESGEPLVDLRDTRDILYGSSPEIENNLSYTKLRKGVYERLLQVDAVVQPHGYRICLYEGLRTVELQGQLFKKYYQNMQNNYPGEGHEKLFKRTVQLVSPVVNLDGTKNFPPHSTGGAVDLYLVDKITGKYVDMGIHPKDWASDLDGSLSETESKKITKKVREIRKLLCDAMENAGFVNYPTEYWHWSYGDRYWAFKKGIKTAMYGSI